jgi:hypothetical protein
MQLTYGRSQSVVYVCVSVTHHAMHLFLVLSTKKSITDSSLILSVSYESQHCSIARFMWCVHMLLVADIQQYYIWYVPACSPACMFYSSLTLTLLLYMP